MVSFATLALYFYRDVWPLTTFTLHPADEAEGQILWAKVALAGLAGFILPIFEPYPYIPVDPFVSSPLPNLEENSILIQRKGTVPHREPRTNGISVLLHHVHLFGPYYLPGLACQASEP